MQWARRALPWRGSALPAAHAPASPACRTSPCHDACMCLRLSLRLLCAAPPRTHTSAPLKGAPTHTCRERVARESAYSCCSVAKSMLQSNVTRWDRGRGRGTNATMGRADAPAAAPASVPAGMLPPAADAVACTGLGTDAWGGGEEGGVCRRSVCLRVCGDCGTYLYGR